jgi:hypothetical protein
MTRIYTLHPLKGSCCVLISSVWIRLSAPPNFAPNTRPTYVIWIILFTMIENSPWHVISMHCIKSLIATNIDPVAPRFQASTLPQIRRIGPQPSR